MDYKQYYFLLSFILIFKFIESSSRQVRSEFTNENIKSNTSQYKYVIKKFTVPVSNYYLYIHSNNYINSNMLCI